MNKTFRWVILTGGILSVLAGLYMFASPLASLASIAFILAVIMLVNGIAEVFRYFSEKGEKSGVILAGGIITIILSLCLMSSTWFGLVSFIPFMFAFWVLATGCARFVFGFSERKRSKKEGNYLLIVGVLGMIAGIFMLGHPLFTGVMVAYMIGFGFVYQGIANFVIFSKEALI